MSWGKGGEREGGSGRKTRTSYFGSFAPANDGALLTLAGDGAIDDGDAVAATLEGGEGAGGKNSREESGGSHLGIGLKKGGSLGV